MFKLMFVMNGVLVEEFYSTVSGAHRMAAFHVANGATRVHLQPEC